MQLVEKFMNLIHSGTFCVYWLFYLGYIFMLFYLGSSQQASGKTIRYLQLLGAVALAVGIIYPPLTVIPILWLLPLSIWQLCSGKDNSFYNYLYCCVIPVLLLVMNRSYGLIPAELIHF